MRNVQYIVKEGDTLWDLSSKFLGNPFEWHRIYAYNNRPAVVRITGRGIKDPDLIYVGQKLLLPVLTNGGGVKPHRPKSGLRPLKVPTQKRRLKDLIPDTQVPFAMKYQLEDLPIIKSETPGFSGTIKLYGSVIIKLAEMMPLSYVSNKGVETSLKTKTDHALGQLLSDTYVVLEGGNKITYRSMMVSNSTTPGAPSTAIGFAVSSDKPVPVLRGEIHYPKLTGQIENYQYAAVDVEVIIEIEPKGPTTKEPDSGYRKIQQPTSAPVSKEAVKEGLKWGFLAGVALLVGTIASDFLTGGVGLADDWVTVPLALSMMGVTIAAEKLPAQKPIEIH